MNGTCIPCLPAGRYPLNYRGKGDSRWLLPSNLHHSGQKIGERLIFLGKILLNVGKQRAAHDIRIGLFQAEGEMRTNRTLEIEIQIFYLRRFVDDPETPRVLPGNEPVTNLHSVLGD